MGNLFSRNPISDKNFTKRQLQKLLLLVFIVVAIPISALIWHGYNQLKWESFHRYRSFAEELTHRIDDRLRVLATSESRRPFTDFAHRSALAANDSVNSLNLPQSPLTQNYNTLSDEGILGYFQVSEEGHFSSPLLPNNDFSDEYDPAELVNRARKVTELNEILGRNQLVQLPLESDRDNEISISEESVASLRSSEDLTEGASVSDAASMARSSTPQSQIAFDKLSESENPRSKLGSSSSFRGRTVTDLNLDSNYDSKSAAFEKEQLEHRDSELNLAPLPSELPIDRAIGQEESEASIEEPIAEIQNNSNTGSLEAPAESPYTSVQTNSSNIDITEFNNEVGPIEFSLLDSGHFIIFRRVWVDNQRLIQGLLLEQGKFLEAMVRQPYQNSGIIDTSNLLVAFDDEVLTSYRKTYSRFSQAVSIQRNASQNDNALLYRQSMNAPFGRLQLLYTVSSLPPGPGARVLFWVTFALASVLCGGFYLLYRTALKQINLAKQQQNFVSSVSHELKTPLTSIRMYSEILKEGWPNEEKKQQYYDYIHNESERLSRLIDNVLKLSNIHNNDGKLDLHPIEVNALMQGLMPKIEAQLQSSDVAPTFNFAAIDKQVMINVDEDSFSQIFINLIDNAIKFTNNSSSSKIDISYANPHNGEVLFSVRDYGPGIPDDQLKRIFELFYRSENELTRETKGTGIGLAIVHQLVEMMGGRIDVINIEPGAEFRVFLPVYTS